MPELPEVEVLRRDLADVLTGQDVIDVPVAAEPRWVTAQAAVGLRVASVDRRGKYLMLTLAEGSVTSDVLVVHLGMTGRLTLQRFADPVTTAHLRMQLTFTINTLTLHDPRGFGFARLVSPEDLLLPPWSTSTFGLLGTDPLDPRYDTRAVARELQARHGAPIKAVLLEQRVIAGLGNYLCDEILAEARVHPEARNLSRAASLRIAEAAGSIVRSSVEHGGVSVRDYVHADGSLGTFADKLTVYGRAGLPCTRCGASLTKTRVAGRGTTWCPKCQRRR